MFGFLKTIDKYINQDVQQLSPLLKAIKFLSHQLGLQTEWDRIIGINSLTLDNFNQHSALTKIIISPIAKLGLKDSYFPLLILKGNGDLAVLSKQRFGLCYLYNAVTDTKIIQSDNELFSSNCTIWQCCPLYFERITNFKSLAIFVRQHALKAIAIGFALTFLTGLLTVITSFIISNINGGDNLIHKTYLLPILLLTTGIFLLFYIKSHVLSALSVKLSIQAIPTIWSNILNAPLSLTKNHSSGELTQSMNDYESALMALIPITMIILFDSFTLIFLFFYMAYYSVCFACLCLLISVGFLLIKFTFFSKIVSNTNCQYQTQGKISGFLNEVFLQIYKIRSTHIEGVVFKKWIALWVDLKKRTLNLLRIEIFLELIAIAQPLCLLLTLYGCVYYSSKSVVWLPLIVCLSQFSLNFDSFSRQLFSLFHYLPTLERVEKLLPATTLNPARLLNVTLNGNIAFSQVNYTEPTSNRLILQDLNFTIHPGEFVGIIGESGSGKSTLLRLLMGFEDSSSGSINLDGFNIKHIDEQTLRKQFGVVLQTSNVFPGTIFDNLTINKRLTLSEAWHLAQVVALAQDIQQMPMKLQTYISDNPGESISGGQKQKILLARALSTNPRILLLDEATSALDAQSQRIVFDYLKKLEITRIVIAHRYSTLIGADRTFKLAQGRMLEIQNPF
jgi:ABC-type bacteriocin/lantibiotic exporter with double-glycine peptidase domain